MHSGRNISSCFFVNVESYWVKTNKNGKVCDFLVLCSFANRKRITVIELKSKSPDILDCFEKIENVCNAIEEFIVEGSLSEYDFYPVILSKSIAPIQNKLLWGLKKVKIRDHTTRIIRENCDISLEYLFTKYLV
jgi:hypothetical protein